MQEEEIIKALKEPEKLVEPQQINYVISYLSGLITDLEEKEWEQKLLSSGRWNEIRKRQTSDSRTDKEWEATREYSDMQETKRRVSKFKRMRQDLKDRLNILTNIKHY